MQEKEIRKKEQSSGTTDSYSEINMGPGTISHHFWNETCDVSHVNVKGVKTLFSLIAFWTHFLKQSRLQHVPKSVGTLVVTLVKFLAVKSDSSHTQLMLNSAPCV